MLERGAQPSCVRHRTPHTGERLQMPCVELFSRHFDNFGSLLVWMPRSSRLRPGRGFGEVTSGPGAADTGQLGTRPSAAGGRRRAGAVVSAGAGAASRHPCASLWARNCVAARARSCVRVRPHLCRAGRLRSAFTRERRGRNAQFVSLLLKTKRATNP